MYAPIAALNLLKEFEDGAHEYFAPEFELIPFGEDDGGYPQLSDRIRPFAQATGSGSTYAVWLRDGREDLATLPVLFLASEGGVHVVARDLPELLRVLASGWTPMGGWGGVHYADEREEADGDGDAYDPCPANPAFRAWLRDRFGLEAAEDPNVIVRSAADELWEPFAAWIGPLIPDAVSGRGPAGER
ncbi:hypothetical protein ACFV2V_04825 [Streptomyces sp. NPDC059698]|uniref:hypothetical protein n=1 Tax=unclassified Streptomyces TaxID=2593676 RepID=UPI00093CB706|nr:hypothetical protein [Streptomyces sp. CB02366]OKJ39507.1 hypothetical protein AMK24_07655 [Streptomyces sp. CB02366]